MVRPTARAALAIVVGAALLLAAPGPFPATADASSRRSSDLHDELVELSRAEARLVEELGAIAQRRSQLDAELTMLEAGLAQAAAALEAAEAALTDARAEARRVARRLARTVAQLEHARGVLRDQAVSAFKAGGSPRLIDQLLRADDLLALGAVKAQADAVLSYQDQVVDEVTELRDRVTRLDAAAKRAEAAAGDARRLAAAQRDALDADRARVVELRTATQEAAEAHLALLARVQERKRDYEAQLAVVAASSSSITQLLQASQAGQQVAPATRGTFGVPVPSARMSSSFGPRTHPIYGDARTHTGIDLAAGHGTPIHAAAAGVVVMSGDIGGYGQTVIVDHGNGLATLYAHQSALLTGTGAVVEAGDVIGAVGSTGASTGPHLHLEVRVLGVPVDPATYL